MIEYDDSACFGCKYDVWIKPDIRIGNWESDWEWYCAVGYSDEFVETCPRRTVL